MNEFECTVTSDIIPEQGLVALHKVSLVAVHDHHRDVQQVDGASG